MFLTFIYLGRIPPEEASIDLKDFKAVYDFYLVAYKFKHSILEDYIVVEALIPLMCPKYAVFCLSELFQLDKTDQRESKVHLTDYCLYILAKNLPK
jgi:hypothetical protein